MAAAGRHKVLPDTNSEKVLGEEKDKQALLVDIQKLQEQISEKTGTGADDIISLLQKAADIMKSGASHHSDFSSMPPHLAFATCVQVPVCNVCGVRVCPNPKPYTLIPTPLTLHPTP